AERAHGDAERESLREALRVKHKALERLTYLYESEQDTEALERVGRPDWLRAALREEAPMRDHVCCCTWERDEQAHVEHVAHDNASAVLSGTTSDTLIADAVKAERE